MRAEEEVAARVTRRAVQLQENSNGKEIHIIKKKSSSGSCAHSISRLIVKRCSFPIRQVEHQCAANRTMPLSTRTAEAGDEKNVQYIYRVRSTNIALRRAPELYSSTT